MTVRFYLGPLGEYAHPRYGILRAPTYFPPDPSAILPRVIIDIRAYGLQPVALLGADMTSEQHALYASQPDVTQIPANLNATIGGALTAVRTALEAHAIPAGWVDAGMTYRTALRALLGIFAVANAVHSAGMTRLVVPGVTLDTPYADMPVEYRTILVQAIDEQKFDRSSLTNQSTLRDLLAVIGAQASPSTLCGVRI